MQHGVEIVRAKSIFTADPEAPSPPLYFECADVTSSCMRLRWQAPFYDGGSEVTDYIVYYTVLERHTTVTARNVIQERALKLKVPRIGRKISRHYSVAAADTGSVFSSSLISGGESLDKLTFAKSSMTSLGVDTSAPLVTSVVIRNLPSDTDITSISVQAVNKVKLLSQKMILKQKVRTREASRYTQLSRELARAAAHSEEWIDTSFFMVIVWQLYIISAVDWFILNLASRSLLSIRKHK